MWQMFNTVVLMFKDLFSNVNIGIIQKTYPKNSIYNSIIMQFVEETNLKYELDLKYTILQAPEVGLWAIIFQVMGHFKDNQVSGQQMPSQHLESPQQPPYKHTPPQPHQAAALEVVATAPLADILQYNIQWVEIN